MRSVGASVPLLGLPNPTRSFAPEPTTSWTFLTGGEPAKITKVVGGMLYARTESAVHALSVFGNEQWRYDAESGQLNVLPTYDTAYVDNDKTIHALSRTDGSERWRCEGERFPATELVTARDAIVLDGGVVALARADGEERWRFDPQGATWFSPYHENDGLYIGTTLGHVYALSAQNGDVLWHTGLSANGHNEPSVYPVGVSNETVFAWDTEYGVLYALSTRGGVENWRIETDAETGFPGVLSGDTIYLTHGRFIRALSVTNGSERWRTDIGENPN